MCKRSEKRNSQGKCAKCNNINDAGILCKWHKIQAVARGATSGIKGRWKKFGKRPNTQGTEKYTINARNRRRVKVENGLCYLCTKDRVNSWHCLYHFVNNVARTATVLNKYRRKNDFSMALKGSELKELTNKLIDKLESQNYKCYYTGIDLTIGGNLSLDHIYPSSDNPDLLQDVNNMVWTTNEVNRLKNSHTPKQFYDAMMELKQGIAYLEQNEDFKKYLTE